MSDKWFKTPMGRKVHNDGTTEIVHSPPSAYLHKSESHIRWHREQGIPCSGDPADPYCVAADAAAPSAPETAAEPSDVLDGFGDWDLPVAAPVSQTLPEFTRADLENVARIALVKAVNLGIREEDRKDITSMTELIVKRYTAETTARPAPLTEPEPK